MSDMKKCTKCKEIKSFDDFYFDKKGKPKCWCKSCHQKDGKDRYPMKYHKDRHDVRKIKMKEFVNTLKTGKPCQDCGKIFIPFLLDFDHRDPQTKVRNVCHLAMRCVSEKSLLEEINKCDLVCANCHRIRTHDANYKWEIYVEEKRLKTPDGHRFCEICQKSTPVTEFSKLANGKFRRWCNSCENARPKEDAESYKKYVVKHAVTLSRRNRFLFNCHKLNTPCLDCGLIFPPYVMDYDHVTEDNKLFSISEKVGNKNPSGLKEELLKCELVCANCHRLRGFKRMQKD